MFVRRSEDKVRGVKTFVVVARVAFIAAIVLAGITSTLSYLTAAVAPKCTGREWLEGYGMRDFVGLSLVCAWVVAALGIAALGRSKRLRQLFEDYTVPVLRGLYSARARAGIDASHLRYGCGLGGLMAAVAGAGQRFSRSSLSGRGPRLLIASSLMERGQKARIQIVWRLVELWRRSITSHLTRKASMV